MQSRRPRRPSHATIVAYAALFVAVGGTSYAAATIGSDDIQRNAVRSKHVKNHSLLKRDFKGGQLPAGKRGPVGLRGPRGLTGTAGSAKGYAVVNPASVGTTSNGAPPNSKGVLGIVQPDIGSEDNSYCFKLGFTPVVGVASPVLGPADTPQMVTVDTSGDGTTGVCPANFRAVRIETFDTTGQPDETVKFKVIFE